MLAPATKTSRAIRKAAARFGLRRFARDEEGAAAIEFGLVSIPFLAILFAIMETAFVFLAIVAGIALTSILLRNRLRNRYKW